jgi:hypothetical protein
LPRKARAADLQVLAVEAGRDSEEAVACQAVEEAGQDLAGAAEAEVAAGADPEAGERAEGAGPAGICGTLRPERVPAADRLLRTDQARG